MLGKIKKIKMVWLSNILLFSGLLLGVVYPEESRIDPIKSTFYFTSRSGEDIRPVFGESLEGRITFLDADGNPLAGIDGENVQLISIEEGETIIKKLSGKSQAKTGHLYATFTPKNPRSGETIKLAVMAEGVVLQQVIEVRFHPAAELVDQCQPLSVGFMELYGSRRIGQSFVTGEIDKISRIKVMIIPKGDNPPAIPVLKLYLWDTDYKTTTPREPVAVCSTPEQYDSPWWRRYLAAYQINASVKPNTRYYFELSLPFW